MLGTGLLTDTHTIDRPEGTCMSEFLNTIAWLNDLPPQDLTDLRVDCVHGRICFDVNRLFNLEASRFSVSIIRNSS
jgi:hypothetical protein